jgi:hypothetical protein
MRSIFGILGAAAFALVLPCVALQAAEPPSISSFAQAVMQQQTFAQTQLRTCANIPSVLHWGTSDIRYADGDLTIQGTDQKGHSYTFVKGTGISGCALWTSDIDGNGTADLELLVNGMDSGGGYDSTLTLLLFDAEGRPFPWQATGKFTAGVKGIKQIIASASGANAHVIVPTNEGTPGKSNLVFELYEFFPTKVSKLEGSIVGAKWPLIETPTPFLVKTHAGASLTFDLAANTNFSEIATASTPKITGASMLTLANGNRVEPPVIIVEDTANGNRSINADPTLEDIDRLIQGHALVKAVGRSCEEEECRPMVLIVAP